ncbi:hypothetical protein PHMEG_00020550 [Phytophthora megakarya]|uniref:Uncharacterized protein n=1 Tax=Phytophthora megakarya TaxID=4795 RepID=A0A225VNU6_9STRA|nr:hypothetical protein PHMEG_00020550 [Phytophthora megakarya]
MFSSWDLVLPRFWYPISSMEQSMMQLEHMSDLMSRSHFPFDTSSGILPVPLWLDDGDFFQDLCMTHEHQPAAQSGKENSISTDRDNIPTRKLRTLSTTTTRKQGHEAEPNCQQTHNASCGPDPTPTDSYKEYRHDFSSYSFSNSFMFNDKGWRMTNTRRRYDDSTGRLKAVHEREVDGKKLRSTWNRMGPDDEG